MPVMADRLTLEAALQGLQFQKTEIEKRMVELRIQLGQLSQEQSEDTPLSLTKPKKRLSEESRRKIAMAQKERWAKYHKNQKLARS